MKKGDKTVPLFGLILFLMLILPLLASVATAEPIIIDTEKGVPGFRTEPARGLPANWQYVHDHPDTSADGWFDTNAYPPGQATAPSGTPSHSLTWANVKVYGRLQCHTQANTKFWRCVAFMQSSLCRSFPIWQ
jgi:hypothetical protein